MNHVGTVIIETERLILRKIRIEDAEKSYENWTSDTGTTRYITWDKHENIEETRSIFNKWIEGYIRDDYYCWIIISKEDNNPIGYILGVSVDENIKQVTVGYVIGRKFWYKGYGTEALKSIVKCFFEEVKVNRIQACFDIENIQSEKVLKKSGMVYEGTFRKAGFDKRGIVDISNYGILASDYFSNRIYDIIVDRPIGYMDDFGNIYSINYGYILGIDGGDGEFQDVYILDERERPFKSFRGKVIGKVIRKDDIEEKWLVSNNSYTKNEIQDKVNFIEKYFDSEIIIF